MHYTEPSVPATVSEISVVSVDEEVNEEKIQILMSCILLKIRMVKFKTLLI